MRIATFSTNTQVFTTFLATRTHMRIATHMAARAAAQIGLATRTHMRIATVAESVDIVSQLLATRTHMRIATRSAFQLAFGNLWQPALTCALQPYTRDHTRIINTTGNPRLHAYCNGKNAQYYNTQSS